MDKPIPLTDNILIIQDDADVITKAGIIIPDSAQQSPYTGVVQAIGDKVKYVREKDSIAFSRLSGTRFEINKQDHVKFREHDTQYILKDGKPVPINNGLVIEQDVMPEKTKAGIYVNIFKLDHQKPNTGTVISKGEDVEQIEVGDRVAFSMYAGRKMQWDDKDYVLALETEMFMIIPEGITVVVGDTGSIQDLGSTLENLGLPEAEKENLEAS